MAATGNETIYVNGESTTLNDFVTMVYDILNQRSTDVGQLPVANSLTGISSLPAIRMAGNTAEVVSVSMSLLKGMDGKNVEMRLTTGENAALQWRIEGGEWFTLITVAQIQKPAVDAAEAIGLLMTKIQEAWDILRPRLENAIEAAENVKDGKTPQIDVGTVEKTPPGGTPTAELVPDGETESGDPKLKLNLTFPTGDTGPVPVVTIGTVTTGDPGSNASATLVPDGTTEEGIQKYKLNLTIPQGLPGSGSGNVTVSVAGLLANKTYLFKPNGDGSPVGTFVEFNAAAALTALRVHEGIGIRVTIEENGDITLDAEIDNEIFVPVVELPTVGVANKIYLVPKVDPEVGNHLDEYIWVGISETHLDGYELLGSVSVTLDGYLTEAQSDARYMSKAEAASKHKTVTLLPSNWQLFEDPESPNNGLYRCRYPATGTDADLMGENWGVKFWPTDAVADAVWTSAKVKPFTTTGEGYFYVYATQAPTENLMLDLLIRTV